MDDIRTSDNSLMFQINDGDDGEAAGLVIYRPLTGTDGQPLGYGWKPIAVIDADQLADVLRAAGLLAD